MLLYNVRQPMSIKASKQASKQDSLPPILACKEGDLLFCGELLKEIIDICGQERPVKVCVVRGHGKCSGK